MGEFSPEEKKLADEAIKEYKTTPKMDSDIRKLMAKGIKFGEITEEQLSFLKNPELLIIINKEFSKKVVKEDKNRFSIFLNACGKYVENAAIASYNLCINSDSGAGKDFIVKAVLDIFPRDDVVKRSRISPTTFTYWHNSQFEPEWTWDNKVVLLSDISNNIMNHEVFKLMCSDGTHSTVVVKQRAVDIQIIGKPVMFITTASADPNNEMLRRFPILNLDESIEQTAEIKKQQAKACALGIKPEYDPLITVALSKLGRVKVRVPFAPKLVTFFPDDHIIMRTHFQRLLDYVKASAALHQYQRKRDNGGYVIAEPQDYNYAIILLKQTTSNPSMIPLTKKQRMLLAVVKELKHFCVRDIEPKASFMAQSKIYEALSKLQELGFLSTEFVEIPDKKKPIKYYTFQEFTLKKIPSWKDIQSCRITGNKESKGKEGIKGKEGNNAKKPINSLNSLNSPLKSTPKNSLNDILTFIRNNYLCTSLEIQKGLKIKESKVKEGIKILKEKGDIYEQQPDRWMVLE